MLVNNNVKEILVLSGKGGTGKTFIASSIIHLAGPCVACDYDVDASNLPLLFSAEIEDNQEYSGGQTAEINLELCIGCGICEELCQFAAIQDKIVSPLACEGCGLCVNICMVDAAYMRPQKSGHWFKARRMEGWPLFYAELRPGEENSGKLVSRLKDQARQEALQDQYPLIISDGPPGIGCAVISALTGVEVVVMVAEPSVSGISDIMRLHELLKNSSAHTLLLINKFDLNPEGTRKLEEWAAGEGIELLGKIPFKQEVFNAISQGICPILVPEIRELVEPIWQNIQTIMEENKQIAI